MQHLITAGHLTPAAAAAAVSGLIGTGPRLVVMIGPAGSGKSSLARQAGGGKHARAVLSLDALRAAVSDDESDQDATGDAVAALHLLTAARLRRGLSVIADATNVEALARQPLLDMARQCAVPAVAVIMATPLETCLARNAQRPGPVPGARWGRRVPDPVVRAQHDQLTQALPSLAAEGFAQVITCVPPPVASGSRLSPWAKIRRFLLQDYLVSLPRRATAVIVARKRIGQPPPSSTT